MKVKEIQEKIESIRKYSTILKDANKKAVEMNPLQRDSLDNYLQRAIRFGLSDLRQTQDLIQEIESKANRLQDELDNYHIQI